MFRKLHATTRWTSSPSLGPLAAPCHPWIWYFGLGYIRVSVLMVHGVVNSTGEAKELMVAPFRRYRGERGIVIVLFMLISTVAVVILTAGPG